MAQLQSEYYKEAGEVSTNVISSKQGKVHALRKTVILIADCQASMLAKSIIFQTNSLFLKPVQCTRITKLHFHSSAFPLFTRPSANVEGFILGIQPLPIIYRACHCLQGPLKPEIYVLVPVFTILYLDLVKRAFRLLQIK